MLDCLHRLRNTVAFFSHIYFFFRRNSARFSRFIFTPTPLQPHNVKMSFVLIVDYHSKPCADNRWFALAHTNLCAGSTPMLLKYRREINIKRFRSRGHSVASNRYAGGKRIKIHFFNPSTSKEERVPLGKEDQTWNKQNFTSILYSSSLKKWLQKGVKKTKENW